MKIIMGVFNRLVQALTDAQKSGCESSTKAKKFIKDYGKQVEAEKQALRQSQDQDRNNQSSTGRN